MRTKPDRIGDKPYGVQGLSLVLLLGLVLLPASQAWSQGSSEAPGLISPKTAKDLLEKEKTVILLDVRTLEEFQDGHIKDALLLPYDTITESSAARFIPAKSSTVVVYCRSGRRSATAASMLRNLGYQKILDLGGIINWPYPTIKGPPEEPAK